SRQNQGHLTNDTVNDLHGLLDELVGVDRQHLDVAMLAERLGLRSRQGGVEVALSTNTVTDAVQNDMAQDVVGRVVQVLPHERNGGVVVALEGVMLDGPAVSAPDAGPRAVPGEVRFHFDCLLLVVSTGRAASMAMLEMALFRSASTLEPAGGCSCSGVCQ